MNKSMLYINSFGKKNIILGLKNYYNITNNYREKKYYAILYYMCFVFLKNIILKINLVVEAFCRLQTTMGY